MVQSQQQSQIIDKASELIELLKSYDDNKSDIAFNIMHEIITCSAESHFEGVGILTELLLKWREDSVEALNSEPCEHCKKEEEERNKLYVN